MPSDNPRVWAEIDARASSASLRARESQCVVMTLDSAGSARVAAVPNRASARSAAIVTRQSGRSRALVRNGTARPSPTQPSVSMNNHRSSQGAPRALDQSGGSLMSRGAEMDQSPQCRLRLNRTRRRGFEVGQKSLQTPTLAYFVELVQQPELLHRRGSRRLCAAVPLLAAHARRNRRSPSPPPPRREHRCRPGAGPGHRVHADRASQSASESSVSAQSSIDCPAQSELSSSTLIRISLGIHSHCLRRRGRL